MIQNKMKSHTTHNISNDIQSTWIRLAPVIHKKRKSVHVFESLARLAYVKGTALFRGNDPLQRSAAATSSLILNTSPQTHLTCSTWLRQEMETETRQSHSRTVHAHGRTHRPGVFYRSVFCIISLYNNWRLHALTVTVECCFPIKLLNELNCKVSSRKSTALSQKSVMRRWEVRQASLSALSSESGCSLCGHHIQNQAVRNNTGHHSQRTSL